jgi:hypothetical protein
MKIFYRNAVNEATISTSSNQIGYSGDRLKENTKLSKLKFTGYADEYVIFDLTTATQVTGFGLAGHNLTENATITIEANATDSWASPSYSLELTWAEFIAVEIDQTYRYWRLHVEDPGNTESIEIGLVYLGLSAEIANVAAGAEIPRNIESIQNISGSGTIRGVTKYFYYAPSFNLRYLSDTARKALTAIWENQGNTDPFILLIWEDRLDYQAPIYAIFTMTDLMFQKEALGFNFSSRLSIREVL